MVKRGARGALGAAVKALAMSGGGAAAAAEAGMKPTSPCGVPAWAVSAGCVRRGCSAKPAAAVAMGAGVATEGAGSGRLAAARPEDAVREATAVVLGRAGNGRCVATRALGARRR